MESRLKVASLVRFCKNAPMDSKHCGVWDWDYGLLVDYDTAHKTCHVYCDGKVYKCNEEFVSAVGNGWLPGRKKA